MNISGSDPSISIFLKDDGNLWSSFNRHTTEMIVTKPGRKIFPKLTLTFSGLKPNGWYGVQITLKRSDKYKYRYAGGKWTRGNEEEEQEGKAPPVIIHRDGIQSGCDWMRRAVKFHDFKLTNNPDEDEKQMVFVQSLHKYTPYVEIFESFPHHHHSHKLIKSQSIDIASFIVVTAYQNDAIKKLKVDNNPFAAGLRQKSDSPNTSSSSESDCSSRKRSSTSPISSSHPPLPPPFPLQMDPMMSYPIMSPILPSDPFMQYHHIIPPFHMPNWNPYFPTATEDFHFNSPILPQ